MSEWDILLRELDAWQSHGFQATFWWRDDDAHRDCPELRRLLALLSDTGVPLGLAVVPAWLERDTAVLIGETPLISVLQHGWDHTNHAPRGQDVGAWELGLHRSEAAVIDDLLRGRDLLARHCGPRFLPVVVPPWNNIDPRLFPALPGAGYAGVSGFEGRTKAGMHGALKVVNCHCDPIRWKGDPHFRGIAKTLADLASHLHARRTNPARGDEPTGFLTHHLDMDEGAWEFAARLLHLTAGHPAIRTLTPEEVFAQ